MTTISSITPFLCPQQPEGRWIRPSANEPEVKIQHQARPEAIYLNCSPQFITLFIDVIRQMCHKYLDNTSQATIQKVLRNVSRLEEPVTRQKVIRQLVGAVFYYEYSTILRLKLKDFARMNGLNVKLFNKKYVAYATICKRTAALTQDSTGNQVKLEQKIEEDEEKEEDESQQHRIQERETHPINNFKQAIELIYDGIFKSVYFQNNRRELIQKMTERCEQVDPRIFAKIEWTHNFSLRLFYVIFSHLKSLGMKVSFTKYRETVKANSGYQLKRSFAHKTMLLMQKTNEFQTPASAFTHFLFDENDNSE